ncbi:hypothetical protein INT48_003567 [Thamnidium elegans]|uniref:Uncharacterized protein n=1 Tax=Thamnidium elegans TaxID=101142 RepID=A0A8H7VUB8_9FUNG|nr:hypothetical protein INT48_003567 [Thamnidium elegans]
MERILTEDQFEQIVAEVMKRVREENNSLPERSELPVEIYEELENYSSFGLRQALQKFEDSTHKYNTKECVNSEVIIPSYKNVSALEFAVSVCRFTNDTRVQARAATGLYENLKHIADRGLRQEDLSFLQNSVEQCRKLAVYGFGIAKQEENSFKESLKRVLETDTVYNTKAKKSYF